MGKLTDVEFHINPTIKPSLQLERPLRANVVQYFQMLKDNGKTGALASVLKEFWIAAENKVIDFSKIKSSEFANKSLKELQMHGKTMNFGFSDEAAERVFLETRDQAKSVEWHSCRYAVLCIIFKI
jgi:hypothetical protein